MINIILSILFATSLVIIFKYFEKFNIITIQAIVINYITASILGLMFSNKHINANEILHQQWSWIALILGVLFIAVFNLLAVTTKKMGVSVATVAYKMSMVIPVVAAVYLYNESLGLLKITGIILALIAVYLTSKKEAQDSGEKINLSIFILPVVVFIGSGTIDAMVNYSLFKYLKHEDMDIFISAAFGSAAISGLIVLLYRKLFLKKTFQFRSLIAGIVLGIQNYFSIYYLLNALDNKAIESSVVFPLNNMGIVGLSSLYAFVFFKENLSRANWYGIILSVISIALISFS